MFGETAGLIAIAFYAVNPWSVFYSRKIWPNELLPLFVMFFIYFIYKAIYEKKKGYIILSLIVLGFIPQLHFSAIYFIIVFFGILLRYWQQINKKYLIIGCIFFALMFTPYATYQFKNNFIDIKKFKKLIDRENRFNQDAFSTILKLSTTNGFEASFGNDYGDFENQIFKINLLDDLQKFALFSAFVYFIVNYNSKLFILFLWLLFGMFSLIFAKVSMLNHYFIHLLPLIFILLGNLFSWMLKSRLKALRYGASVYIIVLLAYQFYFSLSFASYTRDHRCIQGDYGPPFYYRVADIKKAIGEGKKDFEAIHSTCKCVKCDPAATLYIVRYLN